MNKTRVGWLLFAAALVLLVAVNGLVLSRVENNRTRPVARLWLTERELPRIKWLAMENSGVDLRIRWRNLGREDEVDDRSPLWLGGKKLEELGFHFANGLLPGDRRASKPALDREVYLVLEYGGAAYHEAIRRAERALVQLEEQLRLHPGDKPGQPSRFQAKKRIRAEESELSRLFVVDAGNDPQQLRQAYNDPARHIITRGVVGLRYRQENGRLWACGHIRSIEPDSVHVSLRPSQVLDQIFKENPQKTNQKDTPGYEVSLVYGIRFEPWIEAIRPFQEP